MSLLVNMDYDTGDVSQFTGSQLAAAHSLTFDASRRRVAAGYSGRFEVQPGDDPISANGERAEVVDKSRPDGINVDPVTLENLDVFYGWSTWFDSEQLNVNDADGATNIYTQWHQEGDPPEGAGVPPIRFHYANDGDIKLAVAGGSAAPYNVTRFTLATLADLFDTWTDFVFRVRWSPDPAVGLVQTWLNGELVVPLTRLATMFDGQRNYMKQGWYRTEHEATSVIWHDQTRMGRSYAAVDPAQDPPAPVTFPARVSARTVGGAVQLSRRAAA